MRPRLKRHFPVVLCCVVLCVAGFLAGCRKADSPGSEEKKTAPTPEPGKTPHGGTVGGPAEQPSSGAKGGKDLVAFDPALLLSHAASSEFLAKIEIVDASLKDRQRKANLIVGLECTGEEAVKEIQKKKLEVENVIRLILEQQDPANATSLAGRMEIQELIARQVNQLLGRTVVKQAYYLQFVIS